MKGNVHIPIRTCISCGSKRAKCLLVRLALDNENRLIKDGAAGIKGRGAYVCDMRSCVEQLLKNKRLNRQFRTDRAISVSDELSGSMPYYNKEPMRVQKIAATLEGVDVEN
jgi:predicted RNA-binding protein YlxR (DUF448 family)